MDDQINNEKSIGKQLKLPITALCLDIVAPLIFFGLTILFEWSSASFLFILGIIISPVLGIVIGIISLSFGKKEIGRKGQAVSVTAILLPVIFVLVFILLLKTGVAVISFM